MKSLKKEFRNDQGSEQPAGANQSKVRDFQVLFAVTRESYLPIDMAGQIGAELSHMHIAHCPNPFSLCSAFSNASRCRRIKIKYKLNGEIAINVSKVKACVLVKFEDCCIWKVYA